MAQLGTVQSSNTFLQWLSHANKAYTRLDQFAINESSLYANTFSANVALNVKGQDSDSRYANTTNLALKQDISVERAALANTNTFIATKLDSASYTTADVQSKAALANTNTFIVNVLNQERGALANTNTYIATMLPTAGGTMTGDISLGDNVNLYFGDGNDLRIYHDGSNSYLAKESGTGGLVTWASHTYFQGSSGEDMIKATTGAAVELFYANSPMMATTARGINLADNKYLDIGTGNDLQLWHSGSHSYIDDAAIGSLYIRSDSAVNITKHGSAENMAVFTPDGAVSLYYDNVAKLDTTATGIHVDGVLEQTHYSATTSGTVNIDFSAAKNLVFTLNGAITLSNTITVTGRVGDTGLLVFIQDGSGGRTLSLDTYFYTPSNVAISLSTGANDVDIIPYHIFSASRVNLGQLTRDIS